MTLDFASIASAAAFLVAAVSLVKQFLSDRDRRLALVEQRQEAFADRLMKNELAAQKTDGRLDLIVELLQRLEKKLDRIEDDE
jgi:hypothetical protein